MDSLQSKISVNTMTVYFGIFKEPRGLVRLLQFIFAIFAFATACNGSSYMSIQQGDGDVASVAWSYPYNLRDTQINTNINGTQSSTPVSSSNDIKSSAEFFVFTGVTSMLLSFTFAVAYVILDRQYRNDERFPIVDFLITILWTIFWIAGSSAWAQGVTNIRSQTSYDYIVQTASLPCAGTPSCSPNFIGTYANIIVSVVFGFLNFVLWLSSVWFVYKETRFFKSRTAQQQPQQNNFSNIAGTGMNQQTYPQMPGSMG